MANQATISVTENGPLSVEGPITLVDQDGNEYDRGGRKRIGLCRCGASSTKPFCDGTHSRIGSEAAGAPRASTTTRSGAWRSTADALQDRAFRLLARGYTASACSEAPGCGLRTG